MLAWIVWSMALFGPALAQPNLQVLPTGGPVGTTITLAVTGFNSGEFVDFYFQGTFTGASCTAYTSNNTNISNCTSTWTIPAAIGGKYNITAQGDQANWALGNFLVTPDMKLSPSVGYTGTPFTVTLTGLQAAEDVQIYFTVNNTGGNCITDTNGSCVISNVLVPPGMKGGANNVTISASYDKATASFFVVIPTISLSPSSGNSPSWVTVTATTYWPGEVVHFSFNGADTGVACAAGATGGCTAKIWVPAGQPQAKYLVSGMGTQGTTNAVNFTVTPSVGFIPNTGTPGTAFNATLTGFGAGLVAVVFWPSNQTAGWCTVDSMGTCVAVCTVPSTQYTCWFPAQVTVLDNSSNKGVNLFTVLNAAPTSVPTLAFAVAVVLSLIM